MLLVEDADDIYQFRDAEDSESGKNEVRIYMNKETWDANFYGGNSNLTLISGEKENQYSYFTKNGNSEDWYCLKLVIIIAMQVDWYQIEDLPNLKFKENLSLFTTVLE